MNGLKQIVCTFVLVGNISLIACEKYLGFDGVRPPEWNPAQSYFLHKSQVLENVRLKGFFGTKEQARAIGEHCLTWRHPTFTKHGDFNQDLMNKVEYPLDPIAALVQWCYPSQSHTHLEKNTNGSDPLGILCGLCIDPTTKMAALQIFGNLIRIIEVLYGLSLEEFRGFHDVNRLEIIRILKEQNPSQRYAETFSDILFCAIDRERFDPEMKVIYPPLFVKSVINAFVTDTVSSRADMTGILRYAGLLPASAEPYPLLSPLTKERYTLLKTKYTDAPERMTMGDYVELTTGFDRFEYPLPKLLSVERVTFNLNGQVFSFSDCGEHALLSFCLCFLWENGEIHPEFWAPLKDRFPLFRPFVEFFERHTTLEELDKNRGEFAKLMADKNLTTDNDFTRIKYNHKRIAEIVGGQPSLLNLFSHLFNGDLPANQARLLQPFQTTKLDIPEDRTLAQEKWEIVFALLNPPSKTTPVILDAEASKFLRNSIIAFNVGPVSVKYKASLNHFQCNTEQDLSLRPPKILLDGCPYADITNRNYTNYPGAQPDYTHVDPDFIFSRFSRGLIDTYRAQEFKSKLDSQKIAHLVYRGSLIWTYGLLDDEFFARQAAYYGLGPIAGYCSQMINVSDYKQVVDSVCAHPLGKDFLLSHYFPMSLGNNPIKRALLDFIKQNVRAYFNDFQAHPRFDHMMAYTNNSPYFSKLKRQWKSGSLPLHQRYLFEGGVNRLHPLFYALATDGTDVAAVLIDRPNFILEDAEAVGTALEYSAKNEMVLDFFIRHYPAIFKFSEDIESEIRRNLCWNIKSQSLFSKYWEQIKRQNALGDDWLSLSYFPYPGNDDFPQTSLAAQILSQVVGKQDFAYFDWFMSAYNIQKVPFPGVSRYCGYYARHVECFEIDPLEFEEILRVQNAART